MTPPLAANRPGFRQFLKAIPIYKMDSKDDILYYFDALAVIKGIDSYIFVVCTAILNNFF